RQSKMMLLIALGSNPNSDIQYQRSLVVLPESIKLLKEINV
ncbi:MAG: hypothetical protein RLZZ99_875, partial [Actinomycetota bacterium]